MLNKRRNVVSKLSIMSFLMLGLTSSSFAINNTGADSIETMIEHDRTKSVFHFPYRGEVQSFTAPMDGVYKLEAWGAEGGDNQYYWGQTVSLHGASDVQTSNNGAYAQGQYYLSKGDTIYIYVGGRGQDEMSDRGAHTNRFQNGGWNGGGNGFGAASAGGGGATDFRLNND
ncbi:MAG: glycine rich domain-containing protein, partial [Peptostreptococcaceae bacterium]